MAKGEDGHDHPLERMIFFSDAVFAIAITLLVIEIHVPHVEHGKDASAFLFALARLTPNFIGFIISFFVIGAFWAGHHRAFAQARHYSERLNMPNLMMLFTIAAMPFFTAFLSSNPNERVPVVLYCGWLIFTALMNIWVQRVVLQAPVVGEQVSAERIAMIRRRGYATLLGAATAFVIGLLAPWPLFGQVGLMSIPVWRLLLERIAHRAPAAATGAG